MPDATVIAASHDVMQYMFYFICAMGLFIASSMAWFARYILLPFRDAHFEYLKSQVSFMESIKVTLTKVEEEGEQRSAMHMENLKRLSDLHKVAVEIKEKIRCPSEHPRGAAGHV